MSTPIHKAATISFASYAFQEIEDYQEEDEEEEEEEEEMEWSDEEDLHYGNDDEFEDDFDDDDDDDEFDDDYYCDTEEDDDHEYLDDEENTHYRNNYAAGPGTFYPEQPYVGPPIVPKPSPEAASSKLNYYILSPICDIAIIYIKFAILAILIYACALWYTIYYGDLSSINDMDDADADTCPAN